MESAKLSRELQQQRKLWVLLFDELTFADLGCHSAGYGISQDFQSQCVTFEQYYIQNLQKTRNAAHVLREVLQLLRSQPALCNPLVIHFDAANGKDLEELRGAITELDVVSSDLTEIARAAEAQACQLCFCLLPAAQFLQTEVFEQLIRIIRSASAGSESLRTEIIVTALRGRGAISESTTGPDESLMHIPLLFAGDHRSTDAVQEICGSSDLPATIFDLLYQSGTEPAPASDGKDVLFNSAPVSLLQVMRAEDETVPRRLRIEGDDWTALRTRDCLVWNHHQQSAEMDSAESWQLFLKPEDRWNQNDVSRAYAVLLSEVLAGGEYGEQSADL